ncbi:hypothetical protein JHL17_11970 [Azospirillum sp. YIM B02556]|uniref:Uncharacterized protein n=1 Tax=Azospirillum endophyticum TaxID=2800326 RepID=A0ABS1F3Z1_9PROT|nr:hypothetical protein [Azospirillum endophyticum]MBK1838130.1 hypothetical protein [Azospirillum endophyticum]
MPIRYDADLACFEAACTVEDTLPLAEWLEATAAPRVDLSACTELHTALLQLLLAARPAVTAGPEDAFLARVISLSPLGRGAG